MFQLNRPDGDHLASAIAEAEAAGGLPHPNLVSFEDGLGGRKLPAGFAHDRLRSGIGKGERAFAAARKAFMCWAQFDLGWVRVVNPEIRVVRGEIVAVEVHAFGLWSLNLSRIVETVDTKDRFGFVYATTGHHAEEGEERFLLELDAASGEVWYDLEAVSRPRHPLARLGYPLTRALQHRFARDSHRRIRQAAVAVQTVAGDV